jgi:hypothetical protein
VEEWPDERVVLDRANFFFQAFFLSGGFRFKGKATHENTTRDNSMHWPSKYRGGEVGNVAELREVEERDGVQKDEKQAERRNRSC